MYEDPDRDAERVSSSWVITEQLQVGKQEANGKVVPAKAYEIKQGDFVDIAATFDIFTPGINGHKCVVRLWMHRIVRLASAAEMRQLKREQVSY